MHDTSVLVRAPAGKLPGLLELPGRRGALVVLRSLQLKGLTAACQDDPGNLVAEAVRWQLARQVCQLALLRLVKHVCRHGQAADLAAGFAADVHDVLILAAKRKFDRRLFILELGLRIRILIFLLCLRTRRLRDVGLGGRLLRRRLGGRLPGQRLRERGGGTRHEDHEERQSAQHRGARILHARAHLTGVVRFATMR